jgi:3-hydroxyisobutyrate dehydrogenase-like beta-hydroxyacid dehydrogenase
LRYAVGEAFENTSKVPMLQAARDIFDELCTKGFGGENISAAIKAYRG